MIDRRHVADPPLAWSPSWLRWPPSCRPRLPWPPASRRRPRRRPKPTVEAIEPAALRSGQLTVVRVTGGLSSPLGVTHAGDGSGRLFVVQRGGRVRVVKSGTLRSHRSSTSSSRIAAGGERGLLGLAFHPDFETNGSSTSTTPGPTATSSSAG